MKIVAECPCGADISLNPIPKLCPHCDNHWLYSKGNEAFELIEEASVPLLTKFFYDASSVSYFLFHRPEIGKDIAAFGMDQRVYFLTWDQALDNQEVSDIEKEQGFLLGWVYTKKETKNAK